MFLSCGLWILFVSAEQKAKLEAKLHQTTSAAAAASGVGPIHNSVPSNPSSAPGFFIHPSDVIPPTPKTTPLFMTPPLTPPNEAVSAAFSAELAHLFPGSMMDPGPVNLAAHKNTQKAKPVSKPQTSVQKLALNICSDSYCCLLIQIRQYQISVQILLV